MLSFSFFLVLAFTSVRCDVININTASDYILVLMNRFIKAAGETTTKIPAGSISYGDGSITYSEGTLIGLDSMVRTGDCTVNKEPTSLSFDIHFGYSLMAAFFGNVRYKGESMSAFFRIGDNSLRLAFSVHNGTECHVSLDAINYERMSKVVLGTSEPKLDGLDVDTFFQKNVMPEMDKILNADTTSVQDSLQFLCKLMPGNKLFELTDLERVFNN